MVGPVTDTCSTQGRDGDRWFAGRTDCQRDETALVRRCKQDLHASLTRQHLHGAGIGRAEERDAAALMPALIPGRFRSLIKPQTGGGEGEQRNLILEPPPRGRTSHRVATGGGPAPFTGPNPAEGEGTAGDAP